MRRVGVLWLLLCLAACGEKAPVDGAIRVSVKYGSYMPACVRVVARDARDNEGRTDIVQSEFRNQATQEIRVAVFRKPEWEQALMLEVSTYDGSSGKECSGTQVEMHSTPEPLAVPLGKFVPFEVTLEAEDGDGDTFIKKEQGVAGTDCDDKRGDVFPGAVEQCVVDVDFDCDGDPACQDSQCAGSTCNDGNACTTEDRCVGTGASAVCQGQAVQCTPPTNVCFARAECSRETGQCVNIQAPADTACNDNNPCTLDDRCGPAAQCAGTGKACNAPPSVCHQSPGMCSMATGDCAYDYKPAQASCSDNQACTVGDVCDGAGTCAGVLAPCIPSSECVRVTGGCAGADTCTEAPDPSKVNTPCASGSGVCRTPDGECSTFPYVPSNFDPDAISPTSIGTLTTTCAVTFDSGTLTWNPTTCVTNPPEPIVLMQGTTATVLFPLSSLSLNGDLRLVGTRPVILAVYGDATLGRSILANGARNDTNTDTLPGAGGNQDCTGRQGQPGMFSNGIGGGGGGAGGGTSGGLGARGNEAPAAGGGAGGPGGGGFTPLAGGCPGGNGGGPDVMGKGGAGGGAVQLSVSGTLTVGQWITASGSGGLGGRHATHQAGGGGGGGSGGAVLLEAHRLVLNASARLTANGGGAGEGGGYLDQSNRANGAHGEDGNRSSAAQAAGGTGDSQAGGAGGRGGSSQGTADEGDVGTSPSNARGGGGGGGGAVGHIRLRSVQPCTIDNAAVISPATNKQCPLNPVVSQ